MLDLLIFVNAQKAFWELMLCTTCFQTVYDSNNRTFLCKQTLLQPDIWAKKCVNTPNRERYCLASLADKLTEINVEIEFPVDQFQHHIVTLVAVRVEHQAIRLCRSEPQLQPVLICLYVLTLSTDVIRDTTVAVKRDTGRICHVTEAGNVLHILIKQ